MNRPIRLGLSRCVALSLLGLLTALSIQAADPAPAHMIVTVEAHNGAGLPSLKESDVIASQGRQRLRVTALTACQGENAAMELFLVLDDAISPSAGGKFDDLRRFINSQPATVSVGVGHMHNGLVEITAKFTLDHALAAQSVRLPLGAGAASPYQAVSDLIKHWPGHAARREVVLITSGIDPSSGNGSVNPYLDTAIADAQREGIIVHSIYVPGSGGASLSPYPLNSGQSFLEQLSTATGGRAFTPVSSRPDSLQPELDDLARLLEHQYRVTLQPKSGDKAGLKDVRLAINIPDTKLIHAKRMYVSDGR